MIDKNITEKFLKADRWYVRLNHGINGRAVMPEAHYIWLKGNPAFEEIPEGYVIHHLDHDKLNDDISNLVLMQKHHHMAHHFKQKTIDPPAKLDPHYFGTKRTEFYPISKPGISYRKDCKTYCVFFRESVDGQKKRVKITSYDGLRITTKEQAEAVVDKIWKHVA